VALKGLRFFRLSRGVASGQSVAEAGADADDAVSTPMAGRFAFIAEISKGVRIDPIGICL
jgi:hypothetical protein